MRPVSTYWWTDVPNFGDALVPLLIQRFTDLLPVNGPVATAQLVTLGSIIEALPADWGGIVAGTGKLYGDRPSSLPKANILSVRGPLTAAALGVPTVALGDPGLLANELVTIEERDYEVGIVPHWSDTRLAYDYRFLNLPGRIVISPWQDPLTVVGLIGRCKKIVTSSLHGVITADAFGIPRRTEVAARFMYDELEGGMFKFEDYNASIGLSFVIGKLQTANVHAVNDRQDEVHDMFRVLNGLL